MPINNDVIRANKKYEGQSCAICKREISLGDLIHICPNCQSINHEDCWQNEGGCNSLSCNSLSMTQPKFSSPMNSTFADNRPSQGLQTNAGTIPANMVPCRFCKEPIMRGARKCKHCGEYQNEADRNQASQDFEEDLSFTFLEGFAIFCCPFLAIIVGAVYCSQSRVKKGVRIIKYAIIWSIVSAILNVILQILAASIR